MLGIPGPAIVCRGRCFGVGLVVCRGLNWGLPKTSTGAGKRTVLLFVPCLLVYKDGLFSRGAGLGCPKPQNGRS